jgi:hypothetical protein
VCYVEISRVREIIRDVLTETLEEVLRVSLDDYFPNKKGRRKLIAPPIYLYALSLRLMYLK